ncbi:MocR-like pyridoxine biosynthesis transcription factor PdxR [Tenggerimyces flavus]|uniref:PLP-dependent aminotransferase family protein n=1 Tax=Tenggerimyces flavus TaxID=1708749 RepID=A0ABV7YIA2_9ACTN|nr:PLP-dependent aminotransferase family protein [Tenggerimyces flavus]MBM7789839.1 GntR family transcriptional regulator/MocR family aminotransferase [Tenggerimyces flavus]
MAREWTTGVDLLLSLPPQLGRREGLERALREAIQSHRLSAGTRLPATRELATELGISRGTVVAAYDQLVAEGYLLSRHGVGTQVAELPAHWPAVAERSTDPRPGLSLAPGYPDLSRFPTTEWLRSMRRGLADAPAEVYGYGDPLGWRPLRIALAAYLGRARGVVCAPDQVMITSGSVHGLHLLARVLADEGRTTIAVEEPGWYFARDVVTRMGASVRPLTVDQDGVQVESLSDEDAVLLTPTHQFPTGVALSPERRRALVRWAEATGGVLIEDDYDGEFRFDRAPVGALQGTAPEHVCYVGSTSKALGPGLRLGWIVLPPRLVAPMVDLRLHTDMQTEALGQVALADFLASHAYDRHIRASRLRYRRRRDLLLAQLEASRADVTIAGISAGLHALLWLPEDTVESDVVAAAARRGLELSSLTEQCLPFTRQRPGLVIGYSRPTEHTYPTALSTLTRVLPRC